MAAGTWKVFTKAKRLMGTGGTAMASGGITLGAGIFKMTLHKKSASANLLKGTNAGLSTYASIGSPVGNYGNYTAGGLAIGPATGKWTVDGTSSAKMKFSYTTLGLTFKACASTLGSIKYALIRTSTGAGAGKVVCWCTLSTTGFNLTAGNTLIITPNASGVFSLK
jgi:hypothetical protein